MECSYIDNDKKDKNSINNDNYNNNYHSSRGSNSDNNANSPIGYSAENTNNNQYEPRGNTDNYFNELSLEIKSFKATQFKKLENHEGRIKTLEYSSPGCGNNSNKPACDTGSNFNHSNNNSNNNNDNNDIDNNASDDEDADNLYNRYPRSNDNNTNDNNDINNSQGKFYSNGSSYNSSSYNSNNSNAEYIESKANRAGRLLEQRPILSTKADYYSSSYAGTNSAHGAPQYKRALKDYLTKGLTPGGELELTSIKEGFPLRGEVIELLENYLDKLSSMRKIASVDKISSDYATYVISKDDLKAKWVDEYNINDGSDFNEDILSINIYTHEMYTQPNISKRVLEDQIVNIEKWIIEQAALAFIKRENQDFLYGDGLGKPFGFLYYNMLPEALEKFPEIKTAKPGEVSLEDLENLFYSLPSEYDGNGTFLLSKALIHRFRTLKYEQTGQYIWQPSLKEGDPDTLLGIPVVASDDMPKVESGKIAIAFADFKRAYKIIDRIGITILRDPYSHKPYISFYITKRIGADVIEKRAAVLLRVS